MKSPEHSRYRDTDDANHNANKHENAPVGADGVAAAAVVEEKVREFLSWTSCTHALAATRGCDRRNMNPARTLERKL
jgi:hypothetical protein